MKKNEISQKKNPAADKLHSVSETRIDDTTTPG